MADLTTKAIRIANKLWPEHNCDVQVKDIRGGCANYRSRRVSIPIWVMLSHKRGYATYYIAHELSHMMAFDRHGSIVEGDYHGELFMECLREICPPSYWKYEHEYKPKHAKAAGLYQYPKRRKG